MLAVILAHTFVGFVCILGGHPGAKWHIGFPLWMKQNWGIWGYLFPMVREQHLFSARCTDHESSPSGFSYPSSGQLRIPGTEANA